MMESPPDTMVEEREEVMVSPTGGNPFLKRAYFLKPIVPSSSIDEPFLKFPDSFTSLPSHFEPRQWPLNVEFLGWQQRRKDWKTWVDQLASIHHSTWKKAGIYAAILNSTYHINRNDLVYGFAEKWCPDTNTFIFPWGEATITLEDIMVLGGYSVLGESVFTPLESTELEYIEEKLNEERREMTSSAACGRAETGPWLKKFMNSGEEFEHEAFLAFWLSRYVFHIGNVVHRRFLSIAIHLSRGTRIALAPAVLASIYRDLSSLKRAIVDSSKLNIGGDALKLNLWSPFHFVQVWAWERFLELSPKPNVIIYGQPRLAQWDNVNGLKVENLRMVLDSAGDGFQWRPYSMSIKNWDLPQYYPKKEMWVLVGSFLDDELLSFARCLKVSELPGFGTREQYLPHRVAMQFGFDQDLPCFVARSNDNSDAAWEHFIKEIKNVRLYIPPRLSEADVSTKYLEWWKESVSGLKDTSEDSMRQKKKAKKMEGSLPRANPPPGFPPKKAVENSKEMNKISAATITCVSSPKKSEKVVHVSKGRNTCKYSLVPLKCNRMEAGDSMDEDKLTISEFLKYCKKPKDVVIRQGCDFEKLSGQVPNLASSVAEESAINTMMSQRLEKEVMSSEALIEGSKKNLKNAMESNAGSPGNGTVRIIGSGCASCSSLFEKWDSEFKAMVQRIESVVDELKQMVRKQV